MWFLSALAAFLLWGAADLFYKRASGPEKSLSHLKIVVLVGAVMGAHGLLYALTNKTDFTFMSLAKYLPVSAMYILSMAVGYFGLKYIQLSISSPVQNSSGAVVALLLLAFFPRAMGALEIAGIALICGGVFALSLYESKKDRPALYVPPKISTGKGILAILFPLAYCLIDALGTFADSLYLDELAIMSEDAALLSYEFTFAICAVCAYLYIRIVKKERFNIFRAKNEAAAAVFETAGQYFYVSALAGNALFAAPIIASYSIVSVVLSRIFLGEKLSRAQYIIIAVVLAGIALMGIVEGLG